MTEYKTINSRIMAVKRGSAWEIRDNVFETVKAFLLWNYTSTWLPMFPPHHDNFNHATGEYLFPELRAWYAALSKPNSPYKRVLKVSDGEYREWMRSLDLSKPFNQAECDRIFEDVVSVTKREVDEVAIAENENIIEGE